MGINTAIYSQTGAYAGCSFAIPTSIVQKVVADLKKYGTVQRALLGIRFAEVTPELIVEKAIKGTNRGIYVASVEDITKFSPGDRVRISFLRDGRRMTANAVLRNAQGTTAAVRDISPDRLGATFKALSEERLAEWEISASCRSSMPTAPSPRRACAPVS